MSDTPAHDDHWRRLAAELGLDVGPEPEQPAAGRRSGAAASRERNPAADEDRAASQPPPAAGRPSAADRRRTDARLPELDEAGTWPSRTAGQISEEPRLFERRKRRPTEAEIEGSDVEAAAVPEVRPEAAEEAAEESLRIKAANAVVAAGPVARRRVAEPAAAGEGQAPDEGSAEEPVAEPATTMTTTKSRRRGCPQLERAVVG